ncbi:MAG: DUF1501 domain-containing protein [Bacteroidetes bacterium]|nr:MAG: DUF1501 domain-containing protein [Bacteroidota bacterium]
MQRRDFIKSILPMGLAPLALNGMPIRALSQALMPSAFTCDDINDRVLVIVQLHGGNDGLNTLVPLDQYSIYRNYRPIIGIPETGLRKYITLDSSLPSNQQIGLHPDLTGMKELYDQGKARFIQNVSYPNLNGSHFRGTDIWLSGLEENTMPINPQSGWFGRYLNRRFPYYPDSYPNPDMADPPGLEFGSHIVSLGFHRQTGIPMGLTMSNDPNGFYNLANGVGGALPDTFPASEYGDELRYIVEIEKTTNVYADRINAVFNQGSNTPGVVYPLTYHTQGGSYYQNQLSPQLKTVARLLSGGCKTKIFLVRMYGFDTHANQGIPDKPSFGGHSALLYHLSEAIRAFQNDLLGLGLEDRVMTVTFSEFGRQVAENSTWGTDHGTAAPMMVFGKGVNPGVSGQNPNLTTLDNNNLVGYQYDYRRVFTTLLQDWMGANNGTLDEVGWYPLSNQKLPLVNDNFIEPGGNVIDYVADKTCDTTPDLPDLPTPSDPLLTEALNLKIFPNPATEYIEVSFQWKHMQPAHVELMDLRGRVLKSEPLRVFPGDNGIRLEVADLSAGTYLIQVVLNKGSLSNERRAATRKVVVQ